MKDSVSLIVTGTLDPITPTPWGRRFLKYMPNARLIDLSGMSHGSPRWTTSCHASLQRVEGQADNVVSKPR
jgi:pimeloyl-ACP methyl ester carboxylesterase